MKSEHELMEAIAAAKAIYHERAPEATAAELAEMGDGIKALRQELQAVLVDGCEPCETCGNLPHGIHQPTYYEIGCLTCRNEEDESQPKRAKGFTQAQAVRSWNEGDYWLK